MKSTESYIKYDIIYVDLKPQNLIVYCLGMTCMYVKAQVTHGNGTHQTQDSGSSGKFGEDREH